MWKREWWLLLLQKTDGKITVTNKPTNNQKNLHYNHPQRKTHQSQRKDCKLLFPWRNVYLSKLFHADAINVFHGNRLKSQKKTDKFPKILFYSSYSQFLFSLLDLLVWLNHTRWSEICPEIVIMMMMRVLTCLGLCIALEQNNSGSRIFSKSRIPICAHLSFKDRSENPFSISWREQFFFSPVLLPFIRLLLLFSRCDAHCLRLTVWCD